MDCKPLGRVVVRGDMPNEPGDSLFSPKSLEGERSAMTAGGRALLGLGGVSLPNPGKLRMPAGEPGSWASGDEFRRREGNNPDPRLRSSSLG